MKGLSIKRIALFVGFVGVTTLVVKRFSYARRRIRQKSTRGKGRNFPNGRKGICGKPHKKQYKESCRKKSKKTTSIGDRYALK